MSKNTTYEIIRNDEVIGSKSKKAQAVEAAQAFHAEDPSQEVTVRTSAGTVVETIAARGKHASPWTRTEDFDLELDVPAGYTVAYKRNRVGALVARADDKSGWIVITEDGVTEVANTTEAREFTNSLAAAYKVRKEQEAKEAAELKAQAKLDREKAREEARAAKEAEKAAKAEEKAAAKAQKEAEKAAADAEKETATAAA